MDYIYKIEVNCFKFDEKYEWNLLCRKKNDCTDEWAICAIGNEDTPEEAFHKAYHWQRQYAKAKTT